MRNKKNLLISGLIMACFLWNTLIAQPLAIEAWSGISTYQGDIQTKTISTHSSAFAAGIGLNYALTSNISVSSNLKVGRLKGDDKYSTEPMRLRRNLNFKTSIYELNFLVRIGLFKQNTKLLNPYVETGFAVFHYNPYTIDASGKKYFLKPLGTEGQGLNTYPERIKYSLFQISIPLNIGIQFKINYYTLIYCNFGWRKTFTDYIDDISKTFADPIALISNNPKSLELAFRSNEIDPTLLYPTGNVPRGNSKNMDSYFFSGFGVIYNLNGADNIFESKTVKNQTNCPRF